MEITNGKGENILRKPGDVDGNDVVLSDLVGCQVVVLDTVGQIAIEGLVNCKVFVGPCKGSFYVRRCRGCIFTFITNQLRVLECTDCLFYAKVKTEPVVEGSNGLLIGKYNGETVKIVAELEEKANLNIQGDGKWMSAFDFTEDDTPHWKFINENEPLVDIKIAGLSPIAIAKLRDVFWLFDADRDGGLSYREMNALQHAIGSDEELSNAQELRMTFASSDLALNENDSVPFSSFIELYNLQGEDALVTDLQKLGIERTGLPVFQLSSLLSDGGAVEHEEEDLIRDDNHSRESGEYDDDFSEEGSSEDESKLQKEGKRGDRPNSQKLKLMENSFQPNVGSDRTEAVTDEEGENNSYEEDEFDAFDKEEDSLSEAEATIAELETKLAESKVTESFDVLECAVELCAGARHRGVNLQKWFSSYDEGNTTTTLAKKSFETAFSALLLGLCAGSATAFVNDVERILDPAALRSLCDLLEDEEDSSRVSFLSLVSRSSRLAQNTNTARSKAAGTNRFLDTSFFSQRSQEVKGLNIVQEGVVEYLEKLCREDRGACIDLYESLKTAIQSWKWSKGGRTPTQKGGSWTSSGEFISVQNLKNALLTATNARFAIDAVGNFASYVEDEIESTLEKRLRTREETMFASFGKKLDPDGKEISPRHRLVTVSAVMRWIGTLRLVRPIPRDTWLSSKRLIEKKDESESKDRLRRALEGDLLVLEELSKSSLRESLEHTLGLVQIIPDWAFEGEAHGRAQEFLETTEGESAIRKRVIRIMNEAEMSNNLGSHAEVKERAKEELQEETTSKELKALRETVKPRLDLFLEFAKGRMNGNINSSFTVWMEEREKERKKRRKVLSGWKKAKESALRQQAVDDARVALASTIFQKIRELVNMTCQQHKDEKSGMLVCRSSRYEGLDAENAISSLIKLKAQEALASKPRSMEETHQIVSAVSAGDFLLSHREMRLHFEGILSSLLAEVRTKQAALTLLDPLVVAKSKLEEVLSTPKGQGRLESLMEAHDFDSKSQAKERMLRQIENDILISQGFKKLRSSEDGIELVENAREVRRSKAESQYKQWLRNKLKEEKQRKREQRKERKKKEEEERVRKERSLKEFRKWKRAAGKQKYYTYVAADYDSSILKGSANLTQSRVSLGKGSCVSESSERNGTSLKVKRVLKKRSLRVYGDPSTLQCRPAWVVE